MAGLRPADLENPGRAVATVDHLIDEIIEHNQPITGNVVQLRPAAVNSAATAA
jgi:hypothetical protein